MPGAPFLRGEAIDTRLQFLKDIHQSKVLLQIGEALALCSPDWGSIQLSHR
jgi:hypothetical protein